MNIYIKEGIILAYMLWSRHSDNGCLYWGDGEPNSFSVHEAGFPSSLNLMLKAWGFLSSWVYVGSLKKLIQMLLK